MILIFVKKTYVLCVTSHHKFAYSTIGFL